MSKELSFVLKVLISFSELLRELLISSLFLQTIFPPYLGIVMYTRRGTAISLFVLDFGKRYHFLIKDLGRFST
jgi:hypothetical protein